MKESHSWKINELVDCGVHSTGMKRQTQIYKEVYPHVYIHITWYNSF